MFTVKRISDGFVYLSIRESFYKTFYEIRYKNEDVQ